MAILLSSGNYFGAEKKCHENSSFKFNITQYEPFNEIATHSHENAYLSLLINGNYEESVSNKKELVDPGQILFRPAGYRHANQFLKPGGRCFNIELKKEFLEKYMLMPAIPKISVTYKAGAFPDVYKVMYSFCSDHYMALCEEYMLSWLTENARYKISSRLVWLSKVKNILANEFEVHHTIESVAKRVFVHPLYMARAFKEKEGITFGEYQLKMRLEKAMELLFKTCGSVNDIAYSAGFADASHLIRSFRLYYRLTPAKFRLALKS